MLDPAILSALEARMPPSPPPIAEERMWQSPAGAAAERVGSKLAAAFQAQADAWMAELDETKRQFESLPVPGPMTEWERAQLTDLVEEYEAHADFRAKHSARLAKRIRKEVKAYFKTDPSLGAAARAVGDKLIATDKRIVEGLLDYALFLRALRAEGDPASRGGPVFDDAAALAKHLDTLAAA
jgi:hypothetical protein